MHSDKDIGLNEREAVNYPKEIKELLFVLSYQHGYHAGNHADLIKHLCWVNTIQKLKKKNKPFVLFDTHAGAGSYALTSEQSSKNQEYLTGISPVMAVESDDPLVTDYQNIMQPFWQNQQYPGSPCIAKSLLREQDHFHIMELHPGEFGLLKQNMKRCHGEGAVHIHHRDGFEGLLAMTPPTPNRGAVLIDPPYEQKQEYAAVVKNVEAMMKRWSNAQVLIWYPLLSERAGAKSGASEQMCEQLANTATNVVNIQLRVDAKENDSGMYGSGMLVLNPAWELDLDVVAALNSVTRELGKETSVRVDWLTKSE